MPLGGDHIKAYKQAAQVLEKIFKFQKLNLVNLSSAIIALDQLELEYEEGSMMEAHNTRFATPGATVEFAAGPTITGFKQVTAVRNVRRALDEEEFTGDSAKFVIHLTAGTTKKGELKRDVIMGMNTGTRDRIYLYAQMTKNEVWQVLKFVKDHENENNKTR